MKQLIQITAGRGPVECSFVVAQVLKLILEECKQENFKHTVLHRTEGLENGTLQSATVAIEGKDLSKFIETWVGTVQWVGKSQYRKMHKRKNWFIGVFLLEEKMLTELDLRSVQFQTMRSQGAGGQHVNKVSSAVRAIHKKSGVSVTVMDTRSQHQNKKIAIARLTEKFYEQQLEELKQKVQATWENHLNLQRGNPVRKINGTDFKKNKTQKNRYKKERNHLKNELRKEIWNK